MNSETEIRVKGMQALVGALGLVDAETFMAVASRDRFNCTEWRRLSLPDMTVRELADAANRMSAALSVPPGQPEPSG